MSNSKFNAGGYDQGYSSCDCFWGTEPGSLIRKLDRVVPTWRGLRVLDAGCGEGKNARYAAQRGAQVDAFDISALAIERARQLHRGLEGVCWSQANISELPLPEKIYDVVIAYGLLHCLPSKEAADSAIMQLKRATRSHGYNVVCAFNARHQDLSAHPGFRPVLLPHEHYLSAYADWLLLDASDTNLTEVHPHNGIEHSHSLTRILARRP